MQQFALDFELCWREVVYLCLISLGIILLHCFNTRFFMLNKLPPPLFWFFKVYRWYLLFSSAS